MAKTPSNPGRTGKFVANWKDHRVFSDLKKVAKVDDPTRMLDKWREKPKAPDTGGVEKTVGKLETVDASLISILAQHSRAVCRIVVPEGDYTDFEGNPANFRVAPWSGTGFLVAPNILLTNHHVLNSVDVAGAATVEFDYQISERDLLDGPPDSRPNSKLFKLVPDRLFLTSSMDDFDYTFVWIEPAAAEQYGTIKMTRGSFTVRQTEPTFIIHHPGGAPKQASLDDTEVLSINSSFVLYAADTAGGSSGAPVFCRRGRLVALHHAWRSTQFAQSSFPSLDGRLNDGNHTDVVNEGIKLSAIAIDLEARIAKGGIDASAAQTVLSAFHGSDTMTGLFGSLGRHPTQAEDVPQPSSYERVVQVYQGGEHDIDIGAWNIEWLNRQYNKQGKLDRVATVITDLNLDIWALSEVSPDAVNALVERLKSKFNQDYEAAFSEPESGTGKQSTAVLWRPNLVEGKRVDWPDHLDALFRKSSRDDMPFEAVHGKIFNRYPGLFHFTLKGETKAFDFYMVPLHLKAKSEGSMRRKLASKVLSYAVDQMVNTHGADADWVILGDVNGTLASGEFTPLTNAGFVPLSAADEENGGFTYLKSPYKSLIDNIFVSANMSRLVDQDDFYIVATDRGVSRFIEETSDHRPIALRLSLADLPDAEGQGADHVQATEEATLDSLLAQLDLPPAKATAQTSPSQTMRPWQVGDRTKVAFFRDNAAAFADAIASVNATLAHRYGAKYAPLSLHDVAVVYMAEAGIDAAGRIAPSFVHSNGEIGLLPLPSNIAYWTDAQAPAFDALSDLDTNISYYLAYLGALKNKRVKTVENRALYADLFADPQMAADAARAAKLLAGVVHGYFWEGNYATGAIPLDDLLAGYASDVPVPDLLRATSYVHAGKPLLDGRQRNIDEALHLLI